MTEQRTAFIAIVGRPNVGKSSVLNRLLGEKITIVSSKPQTTKTGITGALTIGEIQLVFTDTPGYYTPKNKLGEKMAKAVDEKICDVDAALLVVEPKGEISPEETTLIKKFRRRNIPAVLAINKIDTVKDKKELLTRIFEFSKLYDFNAFVPISALYNDGLNELLEELKKLSFPGEHFFPDDMLTDQPERVIAAEYIREKLFRFLNKEIPYGTAVVVERFKKRENSDIFDIDATIYCEKESHKGIIIGKNGAMLKRVSISARIDMEKFFGRRVNLKCQVKVRNDW